ncbi:MAG: hypothetical protein COA96_05215 [SAR86 cluster bacterium]|uniref:Uncharacterized protein n=1 Tax=SAR86 cluster bacterium TaxID=2030880 RepID=A0A2A5B4D7_9GAMM|nr:MAG: hypothetical protein COA96_05215 [SAR86 cluster bacterium]
MSLLMDALRKAEQAKKKAEQDSKLNMTVEAEVTQTEELLAVADAPTTVSPTLDILAVEDSPIDSKIKLDTTIEFEADDAVEDVQDSPSVLNAEKVGAYSEPELPDTNITAQVKEEISEKDAPDSSAEVKTKTEAETVNVITLPYSFESTKGQFDEPVAESEEPTDDNAQVHEALPSELELRDTVTAAVAQKNAEIASRQLKNQAATPGRPLDADALKTQAAHGSSDRDRRSAKSVFAAKKMPFGPKQKFQVAGTAVVIVVLGFGIYLYTELNNTSGIVIPLNSYAARDFSTSSVSDTNVIDSAVVNSEIEEPGLDTFVATTEDVQIDSVQIENSISGVIERDNTEDIAVVNEPPIEDSNIPVNVVTVAELNESISVEPDNTIEENSTVPADTSLGDANLAISSVGQTELSMPTDLAEPVNLISFSHRVTTSSINPLASQAYSAYQAGSLEQAKSLYQQVLVNSPLHRNALLGLATIAVINNETSQAIELYSRLIARDPSDPVARVGLSKIMPSGTPQQQEAELKRLVAEHPSVAPLAYALGNFLALQQRWPEAQQAYFNALQLAKTNALEAGQVNPDYAFNLAVSLEHLNQVRSAQTYYQQALEFSAVHPAGFDVQLVRNRLTNTSRMQAE